MHTGDDTFEVTIERILPGGVGLAHGSGKTVLVPLAAPGDTLRVSEDRVKGNVVHASIVEIINPSPVRISPPCPYFGSCGGCDFQQLNYEAQLAAKVEIIRDCLRRIGRLDPPELIPITSSASEFHYRARAEWQYDAVRQRLGYYERGSRTVCDVAECAVLTPALQQAFESLRELMRNGSLPEEVRSFDLASGDEGVSISPSIDGTGVKEVSRVIAGERYYFSADGFFQVNLEILETLIEAAISKCGNPTVREGSSNHGLTKKSRDISPTVNEGSLRTALDLYCGAGLFTIPIARRFAKVIGVESNPIAIAHARRNLDIAGLKNTTIEEAPVREWMRANASTTENVDFVLLDPPRTGADTEVINGILNIKPRHITYVSCDPATLARDLRKLIAGGYELIDIQAFDMFPQTHHVETVARLDSRS